jgi:hypothetical protein
MPSKIPDRNRFLERQETLSTLVMQVTPPERTAFEQIARPILTHITFCETHDLYFLDQKHLETNSDFAVHLFPEELEALKFLFVKIAEVPGL